ncbi:MAG: glycoside hydrolase family 88 protein [Bacteroidota bacterium]
MKRLFFLNLLLLVLFSCNTVEKQSANNLLEEIESQFSFFAEETDDPKKVARSYTEEKGYRMASPRDWTCGFPPGTMWQMYEITKNDKWKDLALKNTHKLEEVQFFTHTHDLGFMVFCSYGNAYRLTGEKKYKDVVIQASESLITRFNKNVGCIRSWDHGDWQFPVIIDNMMNLEMLFWASEQTGDPKYKNIALSHADVTVQNHFRDNMSSYHVVDYDTITGNTIIKQTHQGLSDESAWGRGQAWGLYGFTVMYRETGDPKYLDVAKDIADFIITNLPDDKVSYWDYNDSKIPDTYRDASAAVITASALFELATYDVSANTKYLDTANSIIESLNSKAYRAEVGTNGGFLLMHSVGNKPKDSEVDVPINYADYYYLEALKRQGKILK